MPIRIEHQGAPVVGVAGYAAGVGQARARQQKYALSLFQQDREIRSRREEQFQRQKYAIDAQTQHEQAIEKRDADRAMRLGYQAMATNLQPIPDYADMATKRELGRRKAQIADLTSGTYGFGDDVTKKARELQEEYNNIHQSIPVPNQAEQAQRNWVWRDEKGGVHPKQVPGSKPFVPDAKGQLVPAFDDTEEKAAAKDAAKQRETEAKEKEAAYKEAKADYDARLKEELRRREKNASAKSEDGSVDYDTLESEAREKLGPPPSRDGSGIPEVKVGSDGKAVPPAKSPAGGASLSQSTDRKPSATFDLYQTADGHVLMEKDEKLWFMNRDRDGNWYEDGMVFAGDKSSLNRIGTMGRFDPSPPSAPPAGGGMMAVEDRIERKKPQAPTGRQWTAQDDAELFGTEPPAKRQWTAQDDADLFGTPIREPADFSETDANNRDWTSDFMEARQDPRNLVSDQPLADLSKLTPQQRQEVRRLAENPAARRSMEEHFGGRIQTADELYPDQPAGNRASNLEWQHVEAMRGPQGTGEGIRSDADRTIGSIEGAGGIMGREAARQREKDRLDAPGGRITKYDQEATAAERERAMNERFEMANRKQRERASEIAARKSDTLRMGSGRVVQNNAAPVETLAQEINRARRAQQVQARGDAVKFRGLQRGMSRNLSRGGRVSAVAAATAAALAGDRNAQLALDERGIQWRS